MSALAAAVLLSLGTLDTSAEGTATVPLKELLTWAKEAPAPPAPPLAGVVVQTRLEGSLRAAGLQVAAHFEVDVLADDRWSKLELLRLEPGTQVAELPLVKDATVAVQQGAVVFLSRTPRRHSFDVKLMLRSAPGGATRGARLRFGRDAAPVPLTLARENSAFTLAPPAPAGEEGGSVVYPSGELVAVTWRALTPAGPAAPKAAEPAPLEPTIPRAVAVWVSTLEGRASLKVRYELKLDREQSLELELPEGHRLDLVKLNGARAPAALEGRRLTVKAVPARLGESTATLEVALVRELGVFHLSGGLELALPRASWPVSELFARAHLPSVFTYVRQGGSLEAHDGGGAPRLDAEGPLPGKALHFRQYLVAQSMPTLELRYSVDIAGTYFR